MNENLPVCHKCGVPMLLGKAFAETFTAGLPDFPSDTRGITMSADGPGSTGRLLEVPAVRTFGGGMNLPKARDQPWFNENRHCPECGSARRSWIDWLGSDGKPTGEYNYRCLSCDHEWDRCGDDS